MNALGSKEVQAKKDADLKKDIVEGNGKMKPVKLTDEETANVIAFLRVSPSTGRRVVCRCNFSPVSRDGYRVGLPVPGRYREILNTDAAAYGGSGIGNLGAVAASEGPWKGEPCSARVVLPPLSAVWLEVPG